MKEVEAVKTESQRDDVETRLLEAGRVYLDIWKVGVNTALRISDLLLLTMKQVKSMDSDKPVITITEKKTGKSREVFFNSAAMEILTRRLADHPNDKWLFQTGASNVRRDENNQRPVQPIGARSVGRVFQSVGEQVRPQVQLGTHSMRKTRGYFMHKNGISIEQICQDLNHSHPAVTMRYIGLTQEDSNNRYKEFVL